MLLHNILSPGPRPDWTLRLEILNIAGSWDSPRQCPEHTRSQDVDDTLSDNSATQHSVTGSAGAANSESCLWWWQWQGHITKKTFCYSLVMFLVFKVWWIHFLQNSFLSLPEWFKYSWILYQFKKFWQNNQTFIIHEKLSSRHLPNFLCEIKIIQIWWWWSWIWVLWWGNIASTLKYFLFSSL